MLLNIETYRFQYFQLNQWFALAVFPATRPRWTVWHSLTLLWFKKYKVKTLVPWMILTFLLTVFTKHRFKNVDLFTWVFMRLYPPLRAINNWYQLVKTSSLSKEQRRQLQKDVQERFQVTNCQCNWAQVWLQRLEAFASYRIRDFTSVNCATVFIACCLKKVN